MAIIKSWPHSLYRCALKGDCGDCVLSSHTSYIKRVLDISGQFMFDTLGMDSILNNQGPAQALADGLMELSKEESVSILLKKEKQERKKKKNPTQHKSLVYIF